MRGRKPKPNAVHEANGNPSKLNLSKRKARTPRAPEANPVPPVYLSEWGKRFWRKLWPTLQAMRVMTAADELALGELCEWLSECHYFRTQLNVMRGTESGSKPIDKGDLVTGSAKQKMLHPYAKQLATSSERALQYLVEFGLTPSARSRIQVAPGDEEDDLLAAIAKMN